MGMMRQLLMGGGSGELTLVSTTEAHTTPTSMPTIVMKAGASYSITWTGTIPSASTNLFHIYGGESSLTSMCSGFVGKATSLYPSVLLFGNSFSNSGYLQQNTVATISLLFTVNAVSDTRPYYTLTAELYVDGRLVGNGTIQSTQSAGNGLRYYTNRAGTFIVKKLS